MLLKKTSTVSLPGYRMLCSLWSALSVGYEVQEYRRLADIASWVLHDEDRANLLKRQ